MGHISVGDRSYEILLHPVPVLVPEAAPAAAGAPAGPGVLDPAAGAPAGLGVLDPAAGAPGPADDLDYAADLETELKDRKNREPFLSLALGIAM